MTNLDSILKSRDITFLTNIHLVKAMVYPIAIYRCECWTIKKAECRRIDAFNSVVLEKTLESPLNSKIKLVNPKGNQHWVFTEKTEAETPILWLPDAKSQLIGKRPWCWERLRSGGEASDRGRDGWMASLTQWTWVWANSGRCWRTGSPWGHS